MNMKNIFKLSAMMLAAAFVAGCSQNDELDVTPVEMKDNSLSMQQLQILYHPMQQIPV